MRAVFLLRRTVEDGDEMEGVRMSRGMVEMELPPQPPFLDIDNDRNTMVTRFASWKRDGEAKNNGKGSRGQSE